VQITEKHLKRFLKIAGNRLSGDWVIIGGSVIPLIGGAYRVTNDIDLSGPETATQKDTVTLMEIAQEIGLPVEAINQAGAFFLKKVPSWRKQLVVVHRGKKASFFRPNATLYLLLKIPRFSESDLTDCITLIHKHPEELNLAVLEKKLKREANLASGERLKRLEKLRETLSIKT
jgi:hypothetical protein